MKISVAFCLAFLVITVCQFGASKILSKGGNEEITTENGTDILVTKPEFMEVVVSNNNLTFEICTMKCFADFLVCYEPDPPGQNTTEYVDKCDRSCGFYVSGDEKVTESNEDVCYTTPIKLILRDEKCDIATMTFNRTVIRKGFYKSCKPKIENGLVKLNVTRASSNCSIIIKNAQFKRDPTTTTLLPSDSSTSSSGKSSSNIFGNLEWIFVFLSIYFLQQ